MTSLDMLLYDEHMPYMYVHTNTMEHNCPTSLSTMVLDYLQLAVCGTSLSMLP